MEHEAAVFGGVFGKALCAHVDLLGGVSRDTVVRAGVMLGLNSVYGVSRW